MRIKIRFVKGKNNYLIQRRSFMSWKYIGYIVDMGYGSARYLYFQDSKEKLLDEVLEKYYKVDKRFVEITEYPHLKIY
jgi:hypothetical protein